MDQRPSRDADAEDINPWLRASGRPLSRTQTCDEPAAAAWSAHNFNKCSGVNILDYIGPAGLVSEAYVVFSGRNPLNVWGLLG